MTPEKPNSDEQRHKRRRYYRISNNILRSIGIILGIGMLLYFLFDIQSVIAYLLIYCGHLDRQARCDVSKGQAKISENSSRYFYDFVDDRRIGGDCLHLVPVLTEQGKNLYSLDWGTYR